MAKVKAGKKAKGKKGAVRKVEPRKSATRKVAPKSAPPAQEAQQHAVAKTPPEYPWNVIVKKGAERLPVTVTDEAHYQRLAEQFGAQHIEVRS